MKNIFLVCIATLVLGTIVQAPAGQTNIIPVSINKAVQINWPASDGAQYQVYTSTNLTQWTPSGALLTGIGGTTDSVAYPSGGSEYFEVGQLSNLATNRFIGLQDIQWGAATINTEPNGIQFANLRVQSTNLTLADYVTANFSFNLQQEVFQLNSYSVTPGVGVYNNPYFAEDNTNAIYLYQTTNNLMYSDTAYTITSDGSPYFMDLTVGQVPSFLLQNSSVGFRFEFLDPNGNSVDNEILTAGEGEITGTFPILTAGHYTVEFLPYDTTATNVSLTVTFLNANGRLISSITNGSTINLSFANNLHDYAKYSVYLNTNQLLSLPAPDGNGNDYLVAFELLNSSSENVDQLTGLPLSYQPPTAGTNYLFVYNQHGWQSSYYGTVSITTVSNAPMIAPALLKNDRSAPTAPH